MSDTEAGTELMARDEVDAPPAEHQDRSQLPSGMLEPMAEPGEIVRSRHKRSRLIADALEEGRDYGTVPGVPKPFLHKPGAERLTDAFACYPRFTVIDSEVHHDRRVEWEKKRRDDETGDLEVYDSGTSKGLYRYVVSCELVHRASGIVVGNGLGSCSTMEKKYVDRPRDSENTVLKMAKKRAHVDAALSTFGLSEMFTQDADYVRQGRSNGGERSGKASGPVLERPLPRGKHKGTTWGEALEEDPGYVEWALENTDWLSDGAADVVRAAMEEDDEAEQGGEGEGERRKAARARLWERFGRYIQAEDLRSEYIHAFAAHYVDYPDATDDWTVEDYERAIEQMEDEGMEALKDLTPETEAGE